MPKPYPKEFRPDVVNGEASLRQVAKDFGICAACLHD